MKNKSLRIKILSGMLCTGLALSGASVSSAAVNHNGGINKKAATNISFKGPMNNKKAREARNTEMKALLEAVIKDSVKSNVITKTEGDKVLEYVTLKADKKCRDNKEDKKCKKEKCGEAKGGLFNDLVAEGILTQQKSDALRQKMYVRKAELRTAELQEGLKTLVTNKVLTMEQRNKVEEVILARDAEIKEDYKKMKDMSVKEKKDYMKKIRSTKVDPMKVLIDNGTITKEQEKEIKKILPHYAHGHHGDK